MPRSMEVMKDLVKLSGIFEASDPGASGATAAQDEEDWSFAATITDGLNNTDRTEHGTSPKGSGEVHSIDGTYLI